MTEQEKNREYLENLKRQVEELPPLEQAAARAMVNVGNVIAAMITRHDWEGVSAMRDVCDDIFKQAWEIKQEQSIYRVQ